MILTLVEPRQLPYFCKKRSRFIVRSSSFFEIRMMVAIRPPMMAVNRNAPKTKAVPFSAPIAARSLTSPAPIPSIRYGIKSRPRPSNNPSPLKMRPSRPADIAWYVNPISIVGKVNIFSIRLFLRSVMNEIIRMSINDRFSSIFHLIDMLK